MRSKEFAHDYRYFPDPDLLPLEFDDAFVAAIKGKLPELPDDKKDRFISQYGLSSYDAGVLVAEKENADFFEAVAKESGDGKLANNWVSNNLFAVLNAKNLTIDQSPVSAANLSKLIKLIKNNTISGRLAKDVFEMMLESGKDPEVIVEEKGLKQITDTGAIEKAVDDILAANPDKVAQVKAGKEALIGWFVGQVMKATQGKANPAMCQELLKKKLAQ
jgi:aspartyl-tRNA(Asn)/glutamyl-tRNA(Gln) amidotransferase subunit B